jgi:hypothetical protein
MNSSPDSHELESLARRTIWWKPPTEALQDKRRLLAQIMSSGTWDDVQSAKRFWPPNDFVEVLKSPPPGVFDARSWAYWHLVLMIQPAPPLSQRQLP